MGLARLVVCWSLTPEAPVSTTYRGYTVYKPGFWSQGPTLIETLNVLEGYDLGGMQLPYVVTQACFAEAMSGELARAPRPHERSALVGVARGSPSGDGGGVRGDRARHGAAILMRITANQVTYARLLMLPLPVWTVDDRTYDANVSVEAALWLAQSLTPAVAGMVFLLLGLVTGLTEAAERAVPQVDLSLKKD